MNTDMQDPSNDKVERPKFPRIDKDNVRKALPPHKDAYFAAPLTGGVFIGFRKTPTAGYWTGRQRVQGKQKTIALGNIKDLDYKEAVAKVIKWGEEIRDGVGASKKIKTVRQVMDAYWKNFCIGKTEKKLKKTTSIFSCHIMDKPIADMLFKNVTKTKFREWLNSLVNNINPNEPLSPEAVNRYMKAFRAGLNYGVKELKLVTDQRAKEWNDVPLMPTTRKPKFVADKAQRALWVESADFIIQPFLRAMCLLPVRPGSYALCKAQDLVEQSGQKFLKVYDSKIKKYRDVPLTPDTYAFLKKQVRFKGPNDYLFTDKDGEPWNCETWYPYVRKARDKAGLPKTCSIYTLRRSIITDMIVLGKIDILTTSILAGTSPEQIKKHYGQLIVDVAIEKMIALNF